MGPRRKDNDRYSKSTASSAGKKPASAAAVATVTSKRGASALPVELQQLILNQFSRAFPFDSTAALHTVIQNVKGHLYNRDFANAFGQPEHLEAYAVRWSAGRALGYADLFMALKDPIHAQDRPPTTDDSLPQLRVVCIGGGAGAELVSIASTFCPQMQLFLTLLDIADWSHPLTKLQHTLTTAPTLSSYASTTAVAANAPLVPSANLTVSFQQHDVLADSSPHLKDKILPQADLVTIMFTLNELFTASIPKTTRFLLDLTANMHADSHLLVVDSPGSYSEVTLGKRAGDGDGEAESPKSKTKQYPMKWLLDHTLLEVARGKWEKVLGEEARWFRIPEGVAGRYEREVGVGVENMRYQVHLYRKVGA